MAEREVLEPRLPLTFIVPLGTLLLMAFGGGWTLMQSQFANVERGVDSSIKQFEALNKNTRDLVDLDRSQFRNAVDRLTQDQRNLLDELKTRTTDIHTELRHDVVNQTEFKQFSDRLDAILKRLDIVEATRPTTGELKGAADGLERSFSIVNSRVIALEAKTYDAIGKTARDPVEASTLAVTINAMEKRIEQLQQQIGEINRQIALNRDNGKKP